VCISSRNRALAIAGESTARIKNQVLGDPRSVLLKVSPAYPPRRFSRLPEKNVDTLSRVCIKNLTFAILINPRRLIRDAINIIARSSSLDSSFQRISAPRETYQLSGLESITRSSFENPVRNRCLSLFARLTAISCSLFARNLPSSSSSYTADRRISLARGTIRDLCPNMREDTSASFLSGMLIRVGRVRSTGVRLDLTYPGAASLIVKHRQPASKPQQSSLTNCLQIAREERGKGAMFVISVHFTAKGY